MRCWLEVVVGGDGRNQGGEVVVRSNGVKWLQGLVAKGGGVVLWKGYW
jgi:hypothetical protein